jgi:hypothetical protein
MSTTPTARPPGGGAGPLYGLVFLLCLLGAEYYLLTHRGSAALAARQEQEKAVQRKLHPAPAAATAAPTAPIDPMASLMGSDMMAGWEVKVQKQGDQLLELGAGKALRGLLVLISVALIFLQDPPRQRVGQPRRIPRDPEAVKGPIVGLGVFLLLSGVALYLVDGAQGMLLEYGYPTAAALTLGAGFVAGMLKATTKETGEGLSAERLRIDTPYGIVLPAQGNQFVNVPNPFRGILVLGGAGAGKTYSVGEPILEQFIAKGMCGLVYDFKFPVLAGAVQKALVHAGENGEAITHHIINFVDMERTEKVNPLRARDMPVVAYAMEYAKTILTNLNPGGAKSGDNFFETSAEAYLTGIIWFYRNNYPALCTIPHVVATALHPDFTWVLSMLATDDEARVLVQSIITAVEQKAEKQVAGIISSLQIALARLATPEISWVLAPDELNNEGFSLNLNDPKAPKLLTVGNDPTLSKTFSPVISCIVAVALKLMNQQHKHPSFVLVDEGATIYVPGLEVIPATARSNKVAMVYMTQDLAQMIDAYGKDKTNVMVSNLNNQFFGKVNSAETAKLISDMVGKEDREMVSISSGKSMGGNKGAGGRNISQSVSIQERQVVRTQDAYNLRQGEFIGQVVEAKKPFFQAMIQRDVLDGDFPIEPIAHFAYGAGYPTPEQEEFVAQARQKTQQELNALAGTAPAKPAVATRREKSRTDKQERPAAPTVMLAIIQANHTRIYDEAKAVIEREENYLNPRKTSFNRPLE